MTQETNKPSNREYDVFRVDGAVSNPSVEEIITLGVSVESTVLATDSYKPSDLDSAADPQYFGFTQSNGNWYILEMTNDAQLRYFKGDTSYSTNWSDRDTLAYDYYDVIF